MGFMVKSYFATNALIAYPVLALTLFVLVFALVVARAVLTTKSQFDAAARLPFEPDEESRRE